MWLSASLNRSFNDILSDVRISLCLLNIAYAVLNDLETERKAKAIAQWKAGGALELVAVSRNGPFEVQIHGDVLLDRDVDYIVTPNDIPEITRQLSAICKEFNFAMKTRKEYRNDMIKFDRKDSDGSHERVF